jgi:hypothetical protein
MKCAVGWAGISICCLRFWLIFSWCGCASFSNNGRQP